MKQQSESSLHDFVLDEFRRRGIEPRGVHVRAFPSETIVIVEVGSGEDHAQRVASEIDPHIENGFVVVRLAESGSLSNVRSSPLTVNSGEVTRLIEIIFARSRASEAQPSIQYVPDVAERIKLALAPRNTLIFGRRGVGKTALMLEARRRVEERGDLAVWLNMQSIRGLSRTKAFLSVAQRICRIALANFKQNSQRSLLDSEIQQCLRRVDELLYVTSDSTKVRILGGDLQQLLAHFTSHSGRSIFIFLDDLHYLSVDEVPGFLDLLHGICRDNQIWIKAAGIKHQMRWFSPNPPLGLQTGHDAVLVDLDVTLEEPKKAKSFLRDVLQGYATEAGMHRVSDFLSSPAIDRLVLASGGVPRDFLTLCADAIQVARRRPKARSAGVQDVNNAAGQAAKTKLQELEEDAAAQKGRSEALVAALGIVRTFLLESQHITFLGVDFHDKEINRYEYSLVQGLTDLRMLHIVSSSLSAKHAAGKRSEVYLLDLSQYSGSRLKQRLRVLDLVGDELVLKETRSSRPPRSAKSPRDLIDLLREGPEFQLTLLSETAKRLYSKELASSPQG